MIPVFPSGIPSIQQMDDEEYRLIYPEVERYLEQLDYDTDTMFSQEEIEDMVDEIYENLRNTLPSIDAQTKNISDDSDVSQRRQFRRYQRLFRRRIIRGRRFYRNIILAILLRRLARRGYYGGGYYPYY